LDIKRHKPGFFWKSPACLWVFFGEGSDGDTEPWHPFQGSTGAPGARIFLPYGVEFFYCTARATLPKTSKPDNISFVRVLLIRVIQKIFLQQLPNP
jgi:hypothetical protein